MSQEKLLTYKGYPVARNGKLIYYGNCYDPFITMMQVASMKTVNGKEVADRVIVQLINTDPSLNPMQKIVNRTEKKGLYAAMEIANIWLENENTKN